MNNDTQKVDKYWSDYSESTFGKNIGMSWWEAGPEIQNRINRNISGNSECDFITYTIIKYFNDKLPLGHCLSLGCGTGSLERSLASQGAFQHCDAYDVAEGSIEIAGREAGKGKPMTISGTMSLTSIT